MKAKISILCFVLLVTTQNIFSYTISGKVVDLESKKALDLTHIYSKDKKHAAYTNSNGIFKLEQVTESSLELTISRVGYHTKTLQFKEEKAQQDLVIELQKEQVQVEEVQVVKGRQSLMKSQLDLEPLSMMGTTSLVTSEDFEKSGAHTLIDAMKYTPSALIETRGRKIKQFYSFRGQTYPYPTYLINGMWQKEFSELPYFFNAQEIEEIKIVRSSAALLSGLNGLSGVIDVKTKEFTDQLLNLRTSYGTFNTRNTNISHSMVFDSFAYSISYSQLKTDGPDDRNAAEDISNYNFAFRWTPTEDLNITTRIYTIDGERELANADAPAHQKFRDTQAKYDPFKIRIISTQAKYNFSDFTNARLSVSYADKNPKYNYISKGEAKNYEEEETELTVDYLQAFMLSPQNTLRVGMLYNRWEAPNGKRFYYGNECDLSTYSVVATDEHNFGDLHLDFGARLSRVFQNKFGTFPMSHTGTVYKKKLQVIEEEWEKPTLQSSIGLSYDLNKQSAVRFNFSNEMVRPRSGSVTKIAEDSFTDVENENRYKFDLSYNTSGNWGMFNIASFFNYRAHAILFSPETHETSEGDLLPTFFNKNMKQYGIECSFESMPFLLNTTKVFANTTYMKSEVENENGYDEFTLTPNFIGNVGLNFQVKNFDFNVYAKYVSEFENSRFSEDKKLHKLGDFANIDLTTQYQVFKNLSVFGELKNLLDERYTTVVGYYDFGRTFNFGIRYKL